MAMTDERFRDLCIIWVARYRLICDRPISENQQRLLKENEGYDIFSELLDEVKRLRKSNALLQEDVSKALQQSAHHRYELDCLMRAIKVFDNLIDCPLEDGCFYDGYPDVSCATCLHEHWDAHNEVYDYD